MKQVKQPESCFIEGSARFMPVKHGEPQKTTENGACFTVSLPRGETRETKLPADLLSGLDQLRTMRTPRITLPQVWPEIVADALRLASEGWAQQALSLGWEPLQLYGFRNGELDDCQGLAVWLAGRQLRRHLLDRERCAVDEAGLRSYYSRRPMPGAVFLWELGATK